MIARFAAGCYTQRLSHVDGRGDGIVLFDLDLESGVLTQRAVIRGLTNPSYLCHDPVRDMIYAVEECGVADHPSLIMLGREGDGYTIMARDSVRGDYPCYVALDLTGQRVFAANYGCGSFTVWALDDRGVPFAAHSIQRQGRGANPDRQMGPHVHCVIPTPDGRHILLCDAGADQIARYALIGVNGIASDPDLILGAPPGTLPRHLAFHPQDGRVFVLHELGNHVTAYRPEDDGMRLLGQASTLPRDWSGASAAAALRVHPGGRFLYASNRGHDSIALFDVSDPDLAPSLIAVIPTGGVIPRDFAIDLSGQMLVVAHQDSHDLQVFRIDPFAGGLDPVGQGAKLGSPACICFLT